MIGCFSYYLIPCISDLGSLGVCLRVVGNLNMSMAGQVHIECKKKSLSKVIAEKGRVTGITRRCDRDSATCDNHTQPPTHIGKGIIARVK